MANTHLTDSDLSYIAKHGLSSTMRELAQEVLDLRKAKKSWDEYTETADAKIKELRRETVVLQADAAVIVNAVMELLARAFAFSDKPHLLFSQVIRISELFPNQWTGWSKEIAKQMNDAYGGIHEWQKAHKLLEHLQHTVQESDCVEIKQSPARLFCMTASKTVEGSSLTRIMSGQSLRSVIEQMFAWIRS